MMKGQSIVVQYILFFLINILIVSTVTILYSMQKDSFTKDNSRWNERLTVSIANLETSLLLSNKPIHLCEYKFELPIHRDLYYLIAWDKMFITTLSGLKTSVFNLTSNYTLSGEAISSKPIKLLFDTMNNLIVVTNG